MGTRRNNLQVWEFTWKKAFNSIDMKDFFGVVALFV